MKTFFMTLSCLFLTLPAISQRYEYSLTMEGVDNPLFAKGSAVQLSDLTGIRMIRFYDHEDRFILTTSYDFQTEELYDKLHLNGLYVFDSITKKSFNILSTSWGKK